MKILIAALFTIFSLTSQAANYYWSALSGNDAGLGTIGSPWQTLAKLQSMIPTFVDGDSALMKAGEIFYGKIDLGQNFQQANFIISRYGTGEQPVFSGFVNVTSWTNVGENLYEATVPGIGSSKVQMVRIDNATAPMGQYPNVSSGSGGYLTYENTSAPYTGNIYDAQLPNSPSWVGAEIVVRKNHWVIDRAVITAQNNGVINFVDPSNQTAISNFGYFIQNDPRTLDENNEWYYNPNTKKLLLYSLQDPNYRAVKAAIYDTLFYGWGKFYMQIKNITFEGANKTNVLLETSAGIVFQNNTVRYGGLNGMAGHTLPGLDARYNKIYDVGNNGCYVLGDNINFSENFVRDIALFPGMGASDNDARIGACVIGASPVMEKNIFKNIGYAGLKFGGSYAYIGKNDIDSFCVTADDAGGVYASGGGSDTLRVIELNTCTNGLGQRHGTNQPEENNSATGIYMDDRSANAIIRFNTCAYNSENGLYLHNSKNFNVYENDFFDNRFGVTLAHDNLENDDWRIRNINLKRNRIFQPRAGQTMLRLVSNQSDIAQFGTLDSNYFHSITPAFVTSTDGLATSVNRSLSSWRSTYTFDVNTASATVTAPADSIKIALNPTALPKAVYLPRIARDLNNVVRPYTITASPYRAQIYTLIADRVPNPVGPPVRVRFRVK